MSTDETKSSPWRIIPYAFGYCLLIVLAFFPYDSVLFEQELFNANVSKRNIASIFDLLDRHRQASEVYRQSNRSLYAQLKNEEVSFLNNATTIQSSFSIYKAGSIEAYIILARAVFMGFLGSATFYLFVVKSSGIGVGISNFIIHLLLGSFSSLLTVALLHSDAFRPFVSKVLPVDLNSITKFVSVFDIAFSGLIVGFFSCTLLKFFNSLVNRLLYGSIPTKEGDCQNGN